MLAVNANVTRGRLALSAEIGDEGCICLSGENGSGKTTLLSVITGDLRLERGFVKVDSVDVTRLPPEKRGIVLVNPDSFIPHLEVERHLRWGAGARRVPLNDLEVSELKHALGISYSGRVDELSLGMRERVALATALLSRPSLILVDEAFSNIDHRVEFMSAYRARCAARRVDMVFTTQQQSDAELADHHYHMVDGVSERVF